MNPSSYHRRFFTEGFIGQYSARYISTQARDYRPHICLFFPNYRIYTSNIRDQARGRLGRNSRPRGRNFALNGTQGEVGVSLKKKKKKFFFFFRETHFHSVTTQMQAMVTLSDNLLPLHRVSPSIKWQ